MKKLNTVFLLMAQTDGKLTLNVEEVAEIIGCSKRTIYNGYNTGTFPIPMQKRGSKLIFDVRDVAAYIDIRREKMLREHEELQRTMSDPRAFDEVAHEE